MKTKIKAATVSQTTERLMLKEYSYSSAVKLSNDLLSKLKMVNLYDPKTRATNKMDEWFKKATPQLMHDGNCLAYINNYGYLENSFWLNIEDLGLKPEQDKKFQQLLFSVYKTRYGFWTRNFCNLPFNYGKRYKLLPEIEHILNTDSRFESLANSFKFARECAENSNLKAKQN